MRTNAAVAICLAGAVALAGCSSSKAKPATSTSAPTTAAASSSSAAPAGSDSGNPQDIAAIRAAYTNFLDPKIPVAQKTGLIQDGSGFLTAMEAAAKNPTAATLSIQVTSVKVTSANLANVKFTLLVSGSPVLTNEPGFAVRENGTWKVAGTTFCGLLAAQGPSSVPPNCSQVAATSLPS